MSTSPTLKRRVGAKLDIHEVKTRPDIDLRNRRTRIYTCLYNSGSDTRCLNTKDEAEG